MKLTLVKAPGVTLEIEQVTEVCCPSGYIYFIPDKTEFGQFARSLHQAEKEKNEWVRRYEKMYQGLKYWRGKALEK